MAKHALDTKVAEQYGVNIALLLENFQFWTLKNFQRNHHIYDGLCWTYDTLESLGQAFSYWTRRQLERVINNAVNEGLLVKGNYNKTNYDRTCWYALTPKAYAHFDDLLDEKHLKSLWLSISPNGEMDYTKWRNGFPQTVTPIPDTIPDKEKDISAYDESQNTGYTESDGEQGENEKSDYEANQPEIEKSDTHVIDGERNSARSDYFENQSKKQSVSKISIPQELKILQEENIFSLPEEAILDWIANRKKKRLPITATAWKKINKELGKCKEHGIDPIEAFETFVANGWQSFKLEWFLKDKGKPQNDGKVSPQSNLKNYW